MFVAVVRATMDQLPAVPPRVAALVADGRAHVGQDGDGDLSFIRQIVCHTAVKLSIISSWEQMKKIDKKTSFTLTSKSTLTRGNRCTSVQGQVFPCDSLVLFDHTRAMGNRRAE